MRCISPTTMRLHSSRRGDAPDPRDSIYDRSASRACRDQGYAGPYLRYVNILPETGEWLGSILFLNRASEGGGTAAPTLRVSRGKVGDARLLDTAAGWVFWCFDLRFQLDEHDTTLKYAIENPSGGSPGPFTFHLPGRHNQLHWAYYSCNGLTLVCCDACARGWPSRALLRRRLRPAAATSPPHHLAIASRCFLVLVRTLAAFFGSLASISLCSALPFLPSFSSMTGLPRPLRSFLGPSAGHQAQGPGADGRAVPLARPPQGA